MGEIKLNDLDCRDKASLSKGVFKRRTSTRSEAFSFIIDILRNTKIRKFSYDMT